VLLLIAGHENSTSLIGNGAAMLLELPDVRAELAQDPSRWPAAIEELMRLVTPNQFIRRQALEDVARGEYTIRLSAKPEIWSTPTTSTCGSYILCRLPRTEPRRWPKFRRAERSHGLAFAA
jgi:hypothetical protein